MNIVILLKINHINKVILKEELVSKCKILLAC